MDRYLVMEMLGKWQVLLYREGSGVEKTLFEGATEDEAYTYLRDHVIPESEKGKEDIKYVLDQYRLMKYVPKSKRDVILYISRSEFKDVGILICLWDTHKWGDEVKEYVAPFNSKLLIVPNVAELRRAVKYIQEVSHV